MPRVRQTLPTSTIQAALKFDPDKLPLSEIESIRRRKLEAQSKKGLLDIIDSYFTWDEYEQEGPPVSAARVYLKRFMRRSGSFLELLCGDAAQEIDCDAKQFVESRIEAQLEQQGSQWNLH